MKIKSLIIIGLLLSCAILSQKAFSNSSPKDDVFKNFIKLSSRQLLDTANYFFNRNSFDTAIICYRLFINIPEKENDINHQKQLVRVFNRTSILYSRMGDYTTAYELLIKALLICETINYDEMEPKIYNNIGNIYSRFNEYDIAKLYYAKALELSQDSIETISFLNNLGAADLSSDRLDSALLFLDKSLYISKLYDNHVLYSILNNIALIYKSKKEYDSAYHYFHLSLEDAKTKNDIEKIADYLSDLAKLFFLKQIS